MCINMKTFTVQYYESKTFPSAIRVYSRWRWYLFCRSIAIPCIIAHWRKSWTPLCKVNLICNKQNVQIINHEREKKSGNLLLSTIWLSFNLPCQANKGHDHSTIMMINPPAKAHSKSLLTFSYIALMKFYKWTKQITYIPERFNQNKYVHKYMFLSKLYWWIYLSMGLP